MKSSLIVLHFLFQKEEGKGFEVRDESIKWPKMLHTH